MQALQWGVSYPKFMDSLVALVPLARTPAWSIVATDATRQAIMLDPAWSGGDYATPPEKGIRLWRQVLAFLAARTPEWYRYQFAQPGEVLPWLETQIGPTIRAFDANDYIYQSWAYDVHDVGTTPGMGGDYARALRAIEAKTLVMIGTKDLLNPEWEPVEAARAWRRASSTSPPGASPSSDTGQTPRHQSRVLPALSTGWCFGRSCSRRPSSTGSPTSAS